MKKGLFLCMKIFQKQLFYNLAIGIIAVVSLAVILQERFKSALIARTFDQLTSINVLKKTKIEDFFQNRIELLSQIETQMSEDTGSVSDNWSWNKYLSVNEYAFSSSLQIEGKSFQIFHSEKENGVEDSLLVSKLRNFRSPIGKHRIIEVQNKEKENYLFLLYQVNKADKPDYIALELNLKQINKILYKRTGMGRTGESYIVGNDFRMRSRSRFFPKKKPLSIEVSTEAVKAGFNENYYPQIMPDYRGVPVFSIYRQLDIKGLNWLILSEIDESEALRPVQDIRTTIVAVSLTVLALISIATYFVARGISNPVSRLKDKVLMLSRGIIPEEKSIIQNNDEIGEMAMAMEKMVAGIKRTSRYSQEIGKGNFDADYEPLSEHDALGYALKGMASQLKSLQKSQAQLIRQNSQALLRGQENERRRISKELHDSLGQMLSTLRLLFGKVKDEKLRAELKEIIDNTIFEVRRMSNNLMPSVLTDFGLASAVQRTVNDINQSEEVKVNFDQIGLEEHERFDFEKEVNIFRMIQEAMNNAIKHAKASRINVLLNKEGDNLEVEVSDNGSGFDVDRVLKEKQLGNGLVNMQERAELMNGDFGIKSATGKGTIVSATIPV